jgi:hypothetical protein
MRMGRTTRLSEVSIRFFETVGTELIKPAVDRE